MRIALCLSGQPRTWRHCRESLLAFFAGHELDMFLHTWREGDPAELEDLIAAYAPLAWRAEPRPSFVSEKRLLAERFPMRPPLTMFDMFHSVDESLALALSSGVDYDLIVRARFDAAFDGVWLGEAPGPGEIVTPDDYPDASCCNDQFALARPAEMSAYRGAGAWFASQLPGLSGEALRPELVLRLYLEQARGLTLQRRPIAMRLRREQQADRRFADLTEDPLFHAAKQEAWEGFAQQHFPDLAPELDFRHPSRTPLALDRALDAWVQHHGDEFGHALFRSPWPQRIRAIDGFLAQQSGGAATLSDEGYDAVRLICAALLQRMERTEALQPASAIVHMLSDNIRDMRRVDAWLKAEPARLSIAMAAAPPAGVLAMALAHQPPLDAYGHDIWRRN